MKLKTSVHEDGSVQLRDARKIRRLAIRKKDPLEFEEFLTRWRAELKKGDARWDELQAVAELKRKNMYDFLLCEGRWKNDWRPDGLLRRMVGEMKAYRKEALEGLKKEHYDEVEEFLNGLKEKIRKKEERETIPRLKAVLSRLSKEVEGERKGVRFLREETRNWRHGIWQEFWPEVPRMNLVSRKIDLDTRLQTELGKLLADYLREGDEDERVSLETIARLVLVAYFVGALIYEDKDGKQVSLTGRIPTVRTIRDKLRYVALHKAESFRSGGASKRKRKD